jgi:hypothetical protein
VELCHGSVYGQRFKELRLNGGRGFGRFIDGKPVDERSTNLLCLPFGTSERARLCLKRYALQKDANENQSCLPLDAWIKASQVNRPIRVLPVNLDLPNYAWVRLLRDFQNSCVRQVQIGWGGLVDQNIRIG